MVKIDTNGHNSLTKTSAVDCFQIRSISIRRFQRKIGSVSPRTLNEIKTAVKTVIDAD